MCSMEQCHRFCPGNAGDTSNPICLDFFGPYRLISSELEQLFSLAVEKEAYLHTAAGS